MPSGPKLLWLSLGVSPLFQENVTSYISGKMLLIEIEPALNLISLFFFCCLTSKEVKMYWSLQ